ncbi:MAG: hypothetical protein Kow0029_06370 [Candidatus Rifleibacteriota bacterium]
MGRLNKDPFRSFWRNIVVFVIVPALLVWLAYSTYTRNLNNILHEQVSSQILKNLEQIKREGNNEFYIQRQLNWFYGLLSEEKIDRENLNRHFHRLKSKNMKFLNFRFFDEKRRHIKMEGESDDYKTFIQKIFVALTQPELEGESKLLEKYKSFFEAFLGDVLPQDIVMNKSSLIRVKIKGEPGFFYWNSFYPYLDGGKFKGGMIVFFLDKDVPYDFAAKAMIRAFNDGAPKGCFYGIINHGKPENSFVDNDLLADYGLDTESISQETLSMKSDFASFRKLESGVLFIRQLDSGNDVFCFVGLNNWGKTISFVFRLFMIVFLVSAGKLAFNLANEDSEHSWFMRYMVEVVLVYVSLPILLAFWLISSQQTSLFRQLEIQRAFAEMQTYMENVDENYNLAVAELENEYKRTARKIEELRESRKELEHLMSKLAAEKKLKKLFLINKEGKINCAWPENPSGFDLLGKVVPTLSRKIFSGHETDAFSLKSKLNDMMFDSLANSLSDLLGGEEGRAGLMKLFEKSGKIIEFWLANNRYYVFTDFIEDKATGKKELLFIWQDTGAFSENYLKAQVKRVESLAGKRNPIKLAMMSRVRTKQPFPKEFRKYPFSTVLFERVLSTETQQFSVEQMDGETWAIVASPLKRVPGNVLFAMYPLSGLERKIGDFVLNIIWASLLFILMIVYAIQTLRAAIQ